MKKLISFVLFAMFVAGCASVNTPPRGLEMGSATSKNLFVDSSQFANRVIKLRLRNSSGDPALDISRLRISIESGLRSAGYEISDKNFGIVMDVNAFQMQSVQRANVSTSSGVGALLGGIAGYGAASNHGGVTKTGGAVLGAITGATIEEIVRNRDVSTVFIAACDVSIGVVRKEYTKKDRFVVGGNKIEHREPDETDTFSDFALKDTVRVVAYAGDVPQNAFATVMYLTDRLGRVVANLL